MFGDILLTIGYLRLCKVNGTIFRAKLKLKAIPSNSGKDILQKTCSKIDFALMNLSTRDLSYLNK